MAGDLDQEVGQVVGRLPDGTEYRQVLLNPKEGETHMTPDGRTWVAVHEGVTDGAVVRSPFTIQWKGRPEPTEASSEAMILNVVEGLRADPEKYQALRRSLANSPTDQDRAMVLINYATNEQQLAGLPSFGGTTANVFASIWTVTITTIFIAPQSAY